MPFAELTGVHFARLFALDPVPLPNGDETQARLMLMSDVDVSLERHLAELAGRAGAALDPLLRCCEGYPEDADERTRLAYLHAHTEDAAATYVNTVGRSVAQVQLEQQLRDAIETYLDEHRDELSRLAAAVDVRAAILELVGADDDLRPALERAAPPELGFRLRECAHMLAVPLALLALSPAIVAGLPPYAVLLRYHETHDVPDARVPTAEHVAELAALEDHVVQNPFTAVGAVKPGPFRRLTASTVLWLASYATRHVFNDGNLVGVKTIHFARWVFLDDRKQLVFTSNYDGSLESYMDDFIDKLAWGLNAVFSNGVGYPRTSWLLRQGARDEPRFKNFLRVHQAPTQVWYSAYPELTARNLQNNALLRAGAVGRRWTRTRRRHGCSGCDRHRGARARRHAGAARARLRLAARGVLPALRDRGRRRGARVARPHRARPVARGRGPPSETAVNLALTAPGLVRLGVPPSAAETFPFELREGMITPHRRRILGDRDESAPEHWTFGGPGTPALHVLVLAYARDETRLATLVGQIAGDAAAGGLVELHRLETLDIGDVEHFGFRDGISQPRLAGFGDASPADSTVAPGEFVLGYPNEYGLYATRPLVAAVRRSGEPARRRRRGQRQARPRAQRQLPRAAPARAGRRRVLAVRRSRGARPLRARPRRRQARRTLAERRAAGARARRRRSVEGARERLPLPRRGCGGPALPARCARAPHEPARLARSRTRARTRRSPSASATGCCGAGRGLRPSALGRRRPARRARLVRRAARPALHLPEREHLAPVRVHPPDLGQQPEVRGPVRRPRSAAHLRGLVLDPRLAGAPPPDGRSALRHGARRRLPPAAGPAGRALPRRAGRGVSAPAERGDGPGPGYGLPPPQTGSALLNAISRAGTFAFHVERRFDPFFRPALDRVLRDRLERLVTALINSRREDDGLGIAEERLLPGEEAFLDDIIETFTSQMRDLWNPGHFERGGNTKTHGVVRAEFVVRDDVPEHLRHGVLARPRTFPAWVRFSGPGPWVTPDIDDIGFLSIGVKLMGVEGPKLMDDERFTQDFLGVPTPTFVTPDTRANAQLQHWSMKRAPLFYFFNVGQSHVLDSLMQMLWTRTQTSPLECDYFSCVPYLLGEGQAVQLSFRPRLQTRSRVPRLPLRPPDDYLRDAMVATLAREDVEFDFLVQTADRPVPDADREQRRALADEPLAACPGRDAAHPAPALRLARADGVRPRALLQPLALPARAPPARQPEPGAQAHVLRAVAPADAHERRRALRADRRRGLPLG